MKDIFEKYDRISKIINRIRKTKKFTKKDFDELSKESAKLLFSVRVTRFTKALEVIDRLK